MFLTLTITEPSDLMGHIERCKTLTTGMLTIGRVDKSDSGEVWCLHEEAPTHRKRISREHCDVRFENGKYYVVDRSKNGVFLNDRRIEKDTPTELCDGDYFSLCDDPAIYVIKVSLSSLSQSVINVGHPIENEGIPKSEQDNERSVDCCIAEWLKEHYQKEGRALPCKRGQPPPCTQNPVSPTNLVIDKVDVKAKSGSFDENSDELMRKAVKGIILLLDVRNKIKEELDIPRKTRFGDNSIKDRILSEAVSEDEVIDNRVDSFIGELLRLQSENAGILLDSIFLDIIAHQYAMLEVMKSLPKEILCRIKPSLFENQGNKNPIKRLAAGSIDWDAFKKSYAELCKDGFKSIISETYEKVEDSYRCKHAQ
jgi:predicted component of type VI protein secretion system